MSKSSTLIICAALCAVPVAAPAQQWPAKPVRIVTATATGGTLDITTRLFAEQMARATGQSWVVENRAGGLGIPGTVAAARSAPDGYTFFVGSTENFVLTPMLRKDVPYDPVGDFEPMAILIDTTAFGVIAHAGVAAKSLRELIALAKAKPGSLSYGVTGSTADMVGRWLHRQASFQSEQIFYKAVSALSPDLAAGRIQFAINALPPLESLIKAGKVKVLAVTSENRLPGWDSVETVGETVPGLFLAGFLALAVPAGTAKDIQQRANAEGVKIVANPAFLQKSASYGWFNGRPTRNVQQSADFVKGERARWTRVIEGLGIRPE